MEIIAAFTLGILGSLHCILMCGPLALALPVGQSSTGQKFLKYSLYNSGRIFTYGILGLVAGSFGHVLKIAGLQQVVSIIAGILVLLYLFLKYNPFKSFFINSGSTKLSGMIKNYYAQFFAKKSLSSFLFLGVMNGLLPCGLLYMAIIASAATGSPENAAIFMIAFGLGTAPAMLAVCFASGLIKLKNNFLSKKIMPAAMFLIALLFILRGLNLNIPYISPEFTETKANCCHKAE